MGRVKVILGKKNLLVLLAVALSFFGFRPGGRFLSNELSWPGAQGGVRFEPNSMLYGKRLFSGENPPENETRISLELVRGMGSRPRFGTIVQIFNAESGEELTIGQWGSNLMVLNNGDYSNRRRLPKIYADLGSLEALERLEIVSSAAGTVVSRNGIPVGRNKNLVLALPEPRDKDILVLGNRINGTSPWNGELLSLSLGPDLDFDFRERGYDSYPALIRPKRVMDLDPGALRLPSLASLGRDSMLSDVFFNFTGFLPLGLLLFMNVSVPLRGLRGVFTALGACFLFSLSIEIAQIWIPGRDSSLLDLILNTLGGMAGALIGYFRFRRARQDAGEAVP